MRHPRLLLLIALCLAPAFAEATARQGPPAFAQATAGQTPPLVVSVFVEQEGIPLSEPVITSLIETTPGEPLLMHQVRETITHLMSLNRYEDVQVFQEPVAGGVRVRYLLVPLHPIDRLEYRGVLGVDEGDLRRTINERFGAAVVPAASPGELQRQLEGFYRDRGFIRASVTPRVEQTHQPDRATLVFDIQAGQRSSIVSVDLEGVPSADRAALTAESALRIGRPYDRAAIDAILARQQATLRERRLYEARASHAVSFDPVGGARVVVSIEPGPLVSIAFKGDAVPQEDRDRLVPIAAEASVDEDLLEDASRAIEDYFWDRGYRDALVTHERTGNGVDAVSIVFTVSRGPRYTVESVRIQGNDNLSTQEALAVVQLKPGAPYVQATVDTGVTAIRNLYRSRGFTRPSVRANAGTGDEASGGGDRRIALIVNVIEGPRTRIGAIALEGNTVLGDTEIRQLVNAAPGAPFIEAEVAADRDRIDLEYRNRGYDSVTVEPRVTLADGDTRADLRFAITEGPQIIVDQVIVLGNQRTSIETISRELALRPGEPLGYAAVLESQQRLSALGLFRRIQISSLPHPGEARRDVLVQLEEAPATTVDWGPGLEGREILQTGANGQPEEVFELSPRGFFEITRRNLFGKNRSITVFGRVSLRSHVAISQEGAAVDPDPGYGFHEYRFYTTYREPRVFNSRAELLFTGILDQAIRSSFNFRTREVRAEIGTQLSPVYILAGRFSFRHTRLFNERYTEEEKPIIDKLFPRVRISKISTSLLRDTRDDQIAVTRGTFIVADADLAAKVMGSEVGFVKGFVQAFTYIPLKTQRRMVVALAARIGAAHGFELEALAEEGIDQPILLPASERFFAGGDTTVRGFSLDRLGDENTTTPSGFPTGGNGEIVLQSELRVGILGNRAEVVGFVDAGNIFLRARDLDFTNLRPAAGFGGRYRTPVGPVRVDVGFNLDRRELVPGVLERGWVLHISLGQAF